MRGLTQVVLAAAALGGLAGIVCAATQSDEAAARVAELLAEKRAVKAQLAVPRPEVAVLPFANDTDRRDIATHLGELAAAALRHDHWAVRGGDPIPRELTAKLAGGTSKPDREDLLAVGRATGLKFLMMGELREFHGNRTFNFGGFLLNPVTSSTTVHGDVEVAAALYDLTSGDEIWSHVSHISKRHRLFGLFKASDEAANHAFSDLENELFRTLPRGP